MKDDLKRPCADCPWRRNSKPGWLGAATAKEFVYRADRQSPMECHLTVDYGDPNWRESIDEEKEVSYCRGAAEYLTNTFSSPRDPDWNAAVKRAVEEKPTRDGYPNIFGWTDEFLAHHDNELNARYVEASERLHGHNSSLDEYADEIERHAETRSRKVPR